ncbi:MAG: hypothetical protein M3362_01970 [Acidobacteriota bacterium]|nr:hypothetical protein [Acidobacteriota bacterium]
MARELQAASLGRSNKRMHPTADTRPLMYNPGGDAAGDARRYAAVSHKGIGLRGVRLATTYCAASGFRRDLDAA